MSDEGSEERTLRREARAAASVFRLPFRSRSFRGRIGSWSGAGTGSSIDFQDHRSYVPGDDPRHVNWQAYARSGHYMMKLYREEVSPSVDLVLDGSASMSLDSDKRRRSLELFLFAAESALQSKCAVRAFVVGEDGAKPKSLSASTLGEDRLRDWLPEGPARTDIGLLDTVPFRPGSLRVLITDCLFPGAPERVARQLVSGRGQGILFAPASPGETSPDWLGDVELEDCESEKRRLERVDPKRHEEYRERYRKHFSLWEGTCRRYGVAFAQLPAEEELRTALKNRALPNAAVEITH